MIKILVILNDCVRFGPAFLLVFLTWGCSVQDNLHEVFANDCAACHTVFEEENADGGIDSGVDWEDGRIMAGRHSAVDCPTCHVDTDRSQMPSNICLDCHSETRTEAEIPNHQGAPDTCDLCHTPYGWKPFEHKKPISGYHQQFKCKYCHIGDPAQYTAKEVPCFGCHEEEYNNNPIEGHEENSTSCALCHNTSGWSN